MANLDLDNFDVKPQIGTSGGVHDVPRTKNMLVASGVAALVIIVVAALFMTMF